MFTPQRTLAAAVPALAASARTQLVVMQRDKTERVHALLATAGLTCQPRPPRGRLALLVCGVRPADLAELQP
jgi:hypothetical protein